MLYRWFAAFVAGVLSGAVVTAIVARELRPVCGQAFALSVPPDAWPVDLRTVDLDGRPVRLKFACRGERGAVDLDGRPVRLKFACRGERGAE